MNDPIPPSRYTHAIVMQLCNIFSGRHDYNLQLIDIDAANKRSIDAEDHYAAEEEPKLGSTKNILQL